MKIIKQIIGSMIICLLMASNAWAAAEIPQKISLTIGKNVAYLDQQRVALEISPLIDQGKTLVPLRFTGEGFGAVVDWNALNKQVTVVQGTKSTKIWVGEKQAEVNGENQTLEVPPKIINGRTMVPLRFMGESLGYQVDYQSETKQIDLAKTNNPPQAKFIVSDLFPAVGEQVTYQDQSFDPDGDLIADWSWKNNNEVFREPGIYVVSLKVKDANGVWSDWYEQTVEVSEFPNNPPQALFSLDNYKVYVDQPVAYLDQSSDPDGDELVEWAWENKKDSFSQPGYYGISLRVKDRRGAWSTKFVQYIEVLEKPNQPPVAKFSLETTTIDQGVTVVFREESYDPDGEEIVEYQWTGKQRAYFQAGKVPVTLQVKDKRGKWSEPYTVELEITNKVVMTEMVYNLFHPLLGEIVNLNGINPLDFIVAKPAGYQVSDRVLLISNCPETVTENGILYRDTISGSVRLMYHHKNGSAVKKKVYVLAQNMSPRFAGITITKRGFGGPSTDDLTIGKNGLARYLASRCNENYTLAPGETMILDGSSSDKVIPANQSIFAMIDLEVTENIMFTFVVVDAGSEVLASYQGLPVLARDMHQRGTFFGADRIYDLEISGTEAQRFSLADSKVDYHLGGIDATTGAQVINKGNYGLVYTINIDANTRMGLFTNPRGGAFAGAGIQPDGTIYGIPNNGMMKQNSQTVLNMIIKDQERVEFIFVPPVSSTMPVSLLFVPF